MRRLPRLQSVTGQFVRQVQPWTPEKWDEGYVDNRGRFRVYRPDCPRAWPSGYALRSHVVWWLHHGECHPQGTVLHHDDEVKLNDQISNLKVKEHGDHARQHCTKIGVEFTCQQCTEVFYVKTWRVSQRKKEGNEVKYCSQRCYRAVPQSDTSRQKRSETLKLAYREGRRVSFGIRDTYVVTT